MTNDEWDAISVLLDKGFKWREPFGEVQAAAYRTLLDGYDAGEILAVVRMLVARGQVFGPTPGEIVALARHDPSRPTFDEAVRLIFGAGGVLKARTQVRKASWDAGERDRLDGEAMLERAAGMHPLVGAFIGMQGLDRLRRLDLDDQEYGGARRHQLREAWDAFVEANEGRQVALLAGRRQDGLQRLDPLSVLGVRPSAGELEPGAPA